MVQYIDCGSGVQRVFFPVELDDPWFDPLIRVHYEILKALGLPDAQIASLNASGKLYDAIISAYRSHFEKLERVKNAEEIKQIAQQEFDRSKKLMGISGNYEILVLDEEEIRKMDQNNAVRLQDELYKAIVNLGWQVVDETGPIDERDRKQYEEDVEHVEEKFKPHLKHVQIKYRPLGSVNSPIYSRPYQEIYVPKKTINIFTGAKTDWPKSILAKKMREICNSIKFFEERKETGPDYLIAEAVYRLSDGKLGDSELRWYEHFTPALKVASEVFTKNVIEEEIRKTNDYDESMIAEHICLSNPWSVISQIENNQTARKLIEGSTALIKLREFGATWNEIACMGDACLYPEPEEISFFTPPNEHPGHDHINSKTRQTFQRLNL